MLRGAFAAFAVGHAPASLARARSTWTAPFDLLVSDGHLDGSPTAAVPRPRQPPRAPKPLLDWDKDTIERLCESVLAGDRLGRHVWPELDRLVVALLLGTGLRSAELLALNLGTYETVDGDTMVRVVGKGSKPRTVPVPDPLILAVSTGCSRTYRSGAPVCPSWTRCRGCVARQAWFRP